MRRIGRGCAPLGALLLVLGLPGIGRAQEPGTILTVVGRVGATDPGDGGPASEAGLSGPIGVVVDSTGSLYVADLGASRVRRVDGGTGIITTVAGTGGKGHSGDGGPATAATFDVLSGIGLDEQSGFLYVSDKAANRVRRVDLNAGTITTVAGDGLAAFAGDGGPAARASLNDPTGLGLDAGGNLFIADHYNHRVRRVDAGTGIITTVAGNGYEGYSGDGGPATSASLDFPDDVLVDPSGSLFIADHYNHRVRRVDAETGIITTVAGNGVGLKGGPVGGILPVGPPGPLIGDGGPATLATLQAPLGLALDATGSLYVSDSHHHRIRRVDPSGEIDTVAGSMWRGYSGDGGPATDASLYGPVGIALDRVGNMYIADFFNKVVRRVAAPLP